MKKIFAVLFMVMLINLCVAFPVSADPRMETNKNFCHFILDPINTDNEVFFAGCNSIITTVENIETVGTVEPKPGVPECNLVASGYAKRSKQMPPEAAPLLPGTTLTLTSNDPGVKAPCNMVESNGRTYRSRNWTSTITVGAVKKRSGLVKVTYELFCQDGE